MARVLNDIILISSSFLFCFYIPFSSMRGMSYSKLTSSKLSHLFTRSTFHSLWNLFMLIDATKENQLFMNRTRFSMIPGK